MYYATPFFYGGTATVRILVVDAIDKLHDRSCTVSSLAFVGNKLKVVVVLQLLPP